jgi:hypothetical protein
LSTPGGKTVLDIDIASLCVQYGRVQRRFFTGLDLLRKKKGHSLVKFIYDAAKQDIPIDAVKKQLLMV